MASTHKKVIVRRFLGDVLAGYLPVERFLHHGSIGLLGLDGRLNSVMLSDVKHISYVRDFNLSDGSAPERLSRRTFLARPRSPGLWIRVTFRSPANSSPDPRSPDLLEGLVATDLALLDDLLADSGLQLVPPDTRSNTQRVFIPRSSIADLRILAVITSPSRGRSALTSVDPVQEIQDNLFPPLLLPNTVEAE